MFLLCSLIFGGTGHNQPSAGFLEQECICTTLPPVLILPLHVTALGFAAFSDMRSLTTVLRSPCFPVFLFFSSLSDLAYKLHLKILLFRGGLFKVFINIFAFWTISTVQSDCYKTFFNLRKILLLGLLVQHGYKFWTLGKSQNSILKSNNLLIILISNLHKQTAQVTTLFTDLRDHDCLWEKLTSGVYNLAVSRQYKQFYGTKELLAAS